MADSDRSEKPTWRKRTKTRQEGRVARSRDLPQAFAFLSIIIYVIYTGGDILQKIKNLLSGYLMLASEPHLPFATVSFIHYQAMDLILRIIGPICLVAVLFSLVGSFAGGGWMFAPKALHLKWDRFSPMHGLQRLMPKMAGFEFLKNIIYTIVVSTIAWKAAKQELLGLPALVLMPPDYSFHSLTDAIFRFAIRVGIFMLILAFGDFLYQRYIFEESLKMTKQEVKDDYREVEGNPQIKARIRRMQREMSRRRMMAAVPKADVVITNPTHFAIAIAYRPLEMIAPTVVAKGQNYIAETIKQIARKSEVPIVENPPLAQALYKSADVGDQIPANLYKAVAELLAYLIRFRGHVLKSAEPDLRRSKRTIKGIQPSLPAFSGDAAHVDLRSQTSGLVGGSPDRTISNPGLESIG